MFVLVTGRSRIWRSFAGGDGSNQEEERDKKGEDRDVRKMEEEGDARGRQRRRLGLVLVGLLGFV